MNASIIKLILITAVSIILFSAKPGRSQDRWEPRGLSTEAVNVMKINTSGTIFAGGSKLFRSSNAGLNWTGLVGINEDVLSLDINNSNNTIFASTQRGIWRSVNNGDSWELIPGTIRCSALGVNKNGDIYGFTAESGNIIRSTNNGVNWSAVSRLAAGDAGSFTFNNLGHIYLGTYLNGLYCSKDNGASWVNIGQSFTYPSCVTAVTVDKTNGDIYAADHFNGMLSTFYNIYRSSDQGVTWTKIREDWGKVENIVSDSRIGTIYTADQVFITSDNGGSWKAINSGLPEQFKISALEVSPDGSLYAGSFGVFKFQRPTTVISQYVNGIPDEFFLEQNFPNPFNPMTSINYTISKGGFVKLHVYDIAGKETAVLVSRYQNPGEYKVNFNADGLAGGTYFYRLEANGFSEIRKMQLIK